MKTVKHIFVALGSIALLLFTACQKNLLSTSPTSLIASSDIFSDSALMETYVIGRYLGETLNDENTAPEFQRAFDAPWLSSCTDESVATQDNGSYIIEQGIYTPDNMSFMSNFWYRSYRSIREINFALAGINKVPMSAATLNRLVGELHFIRAYRYHDLIRNYGGVPIMGNTVWGLTDTNYTPTYARSSLQDCLTYAENECDSAITGLTGVTLPTGRASMEAAMALKARLLLYAASPLYTGGTNDQGKWAAAAAANKAVMDLKEFTLYPDYRQEFLTNTTTEDIFERLYSPVVGHSGLELVDGPNGYNGWGGQTPLQNFVDAYEMANGKPISDPTSGYNPQDPYTNRDPRLAETVLYNGHPYRGRNVQCYVPGGLDSKDGPGPWNTTLTGYYILKYMNENLNPGQQDNLYADQTQDQPFKYIRYAETLLNYAEAQNEAVGPDQSVYDALNLIRARAGMPDITPGLAQDSMRHTIWNERQVELSFEDHRFYDVRRWMIANVTENVPAYGILPTLNPDSTITYSRITALGNRSFSTKNYWMPIPQGDILASGGKIQQNPGY